MGHVDNRGHKRYIPPNRGNLADEGLVDLETVDRKFLQIAQI
jgi:hypothetical protein